MMTILLEECNKPVMRTLRKMTGKDDGSIVRDISILVYSLDVMKFKQKVFFHNWGIHSGEPFRRLNVGSRRLKVQMLKKSERLKVWTFVKGSKIESALYNAK